MKLSCLQASLVSCKIRMCIHSLVRTHSCLGDIILQFASVLCIFQVDGMDCLAVKQAVKYAKAHALKSGPFVRSCSPMVS